MAKLLLDYGADRDARDVEGWTPLHAASACGNLTMINLLVESGSSLVALNHDDKMPVDVACDGDIRYVLQQKMLEAGKKSGHMLYQGLYLHAVSRLVLTCCIKACNYIINWMYVWQF